MEEPWRYEAGPVIDHWREYNMESDERNFSEVNMPPLLGITGFNKCLISINSVTFTNTIRTLKKDDYIVINNQKYVFNREITDINPGLFLSVLSQAIDGSGVAANLTETHIIRFNSDNAFTIDSMSYNVSLLIGIKQNQLPRTAIREEGLYEIRAPRFGDYNSTPIFYLMTSLGISGDGSGMFVQTEDGGMSSHNMFMRFNNTWNPEHNVNYIGGDVKYYTDVSVLGQTSWIRLVDANLERVDLLNPMYVSLYVEFVKDVASATTRFAGNPRLL